MSTQDALAICMACSLVAAFVGFVVTGWLRDRPKPNTTPNPKRTVTMLQLIWNRHTYRLLKLAAAANLALWCASSAIGGAVSLKTGVPVQTWATQALYTEGSALWTAGSVLVALGKTALGWNWQDMLLAAGAAVVLGRVAWKVRGWGSTSTTQRDEWKQAAVRVIEKEAEAARGKYTAMKADRDRLALALAREEAGSSRGVPDNFVERVMEHMCAEKLSGYGWDSVRKRHIRDVIIQELAPDESRQRATA